MLLVSPCSWLYLDKILQCSLISITTIEHPRDFVSVYKRPLKDSAVQLYPPDVYGHVSEQMKDESAARMQAYINGIQGA